MGFLDYIILVLSCVAEVYICYDFVGAFFYYKTNKLWVNLLLYSISAIMILGINLLGVANLNLLTVPIVLLLFVLLIFDISFIQALMHTLIVVFAFLGGEFFFLFFSGYIQSDSASNLADVPGVTFLAKLISYLILTIIKLISQKSNKRMTKKVFVLYLCVPIASLVMMLTSYFVVEPYLYDARNQIALTVSYALMLFGNIIIFFAFNDYADEIQQRIEQEWQLEKERINKDYYTKVARINEEQRSIMHDIKHYLRLITSLNNQEERKHIKKLAEKLNVEIEESERQLISDAPILDVLLSERKSYATKNNIEFNAFVEPGLRFGDIGEADYIIILSNIIDNATEAASKTIGNKTVDVNIFTSENNGFIVCKVYNTYNKDDIVIVDGEFISTKDNKGIHGYGIKSIKKAAEKNGGIFNILIETDLVESTLIIPV